MSFINRNSLSFVPNCISLMSFSCLFPPTSTLNTIMKSSGISVSCLILNFSMIAPSFSIRMMLAMGFSYASFILLGALILLVLNSLESFFCHEEMLFLSKVLLCIYLYDHMIFVLKLTFVIFLFSLLNYIYYVEPLLHFIDKVHFVIMCRVALCLCVIMHAHACVGTIGGCQVVALPLSRLIIFLK